MRGRQEIVFIIFQQTEWFTNPENTELDPIKWKYLSADDRKIIEQNNTLGKNIYKRKLTKVINWIKLVWNKINNSDNSILENL